MRNNHPSNVKDAIAATQDGKKLNKTSRFSDFILSCIDANTDAGNSYVDIDSLKSDFEYMISELNKAVVPLRVYSDYHNY